jgi:hypothetical protein
VVGYFFFLKRFARTVFTGSHVSLTECPVHQTSIWVLRQTNQHPDAGIDKPAPDAAIDKPAPDAA